MKLADVIPIVRGLPVDELTYYSSRDLAEGTLVSISFHGRKATGIVVRTRNVGDLKSEIKSSKIVYKKISGVKTQRLFSNEFLQSAKFVADYFAGTLGATISALVPAFVISEPEKYAAPKIRKPESGPEKKNEHIALQASTDERYLSYKNAIRESFARGRSIICLAPTIEDAENMYHELNRGIEQYSYLLHSAKSDDAVREAYRKAFEELHPVVIICTPTFMSIPRGDIGLVITEREHSDSYKGLVRPYVDYRVAASRFAREMGANTIIGDTMLRPETHRELSRGELTQGTAFKQRLSDYVRPTIVEVSNKKSSDDGPPSAISKFLSKALVEEMLSRGHAALITLKKGVASITICSDCGELVTCSGCKSPMGIYNGKKKSDLPYFLCKRCGKSLSSSRKCAKCDGWNLVPLGFGVDRVKEELDVMFPDNKKFLLSGDTVKNHHEAETLMKSFRETPGAILVGTEMVLRYLTPPIPVVGLISLDPLFTIPDYRINERIFQFVMACGIGASKKFFIQTRRPKEKIWEFLKIGITQEFYRKELEVREAYSYPPFSVLIKITWNGTPAKKERAEKMLNDLFGRYAPILYNEPERDSGARIHMLLRIPREKWPPKLPENLEELNPESYDAILPLLRSLPSQCRVDVGPINMF